MSVYVQGHVRVSKYHQVIQKVTEEKREEGEWRCGVKIIVDKRKSKMAPSVIFLPPVLKEKGLGNEKPASCRQYAI